MVVPGSDRVVLPKEEIHGVNRVNRGVTQSTQTNVHGATVVLAFDHYIR